MTGELFIRDSAEAQLNLHPTPQVAIVRIDADGRIFWRDREVETDDDFRAAMRDLYSAMVLNLR